MQGNGYFGGFLRRGALPAELDGNDDPASTAPWRCIAGDHELFLEVRGDGWQSVAADNLTVLVRGQAGFVDADDPQPADVAAAIHWHYRQHGALPIERLHGSFTLAALDGNVGRVVLYRNLVGTGFTYYTVTADGLHFGSNLADLVDRCGQGPRPNTEVLPAYFLFRFVPGRQTLFAGCYRLMPGEQLTFDTHGLRRLQRHTFTDLKRGGPIGSDAVDRIEQTMRRVLADQAARRSPTANLLSGGVDSSYLQAVWNRVRPTGDGAPSFSVVVDHPRTQNDTAYALTAARALGCRHTLVPTAAPYAQYLLEAVATTGEPPNHAMTVYLGQLARSMRTHGIAHGLCGEGADSLFGIGTADVVRSARVIRSVLPWQLAQRFGAALASAAGRHILPAAFRLAAHVDDYACWQHPVNQVAVFADWPAVSACFGDDGIRDALAYRRSLLDQYAVEADPLERLHAVGYLGEAVDSAALWTTLFNAAGADLCCPYLDSRLLGLALRLPQRERFRYRRPKDLLKRALARHVPREMAYRRKLGFGQPVFEWMAPGGQLRPWVEDIGRHEFVAPAALTTALARPNWFLYSLLCYDLWHKLFIERSLPRRSFASPPRTAESTALALQGCRS